MPKVDPAIGALGSRGLNELHNVFKTTKDQTLLLEICRAFGVIANTGNNWLSSFLFSFLTFITAREKLRFGELCQILLNMLTMGLPAQEAALDIFPPLLFKNGIFNSNMEFVNVYFIANHQAIFMKLQGIDAVLSILRTGGSEDIKGRAAKVVHALSFQNST